MDYSNPLLISIRKAGQKIGILKPLQRLYRRVSKSEYEQGFDEALMEAIRPGDIVWDVGANIGYYTRRFAEKTGDSGKVFAFEPSPAAAKEIWHACQGLEQVVVCELALSDVSGTFPFSMSESTATTNSLAGSTIPSTAIINVEVTTGDAALREFAVPNVVKIDVEGYEPEVLRGMMSTLQSASLRAVFIEVHFSALNSRGCGAEPKKMVGLLKKSGLTVKWVDPSHIAAYRH